MSNLTIQQFADECILTNQAIHKKIAKGEIETLKTTPLKIDATRYDFMIKYFQNKHETKTKN